jgi:sigma-B regulation protein RsbU (phosphoserine phosphatase)
MDVLAVFRHDATALSIGVTLSLTGVALGAFAVAGRNLQLFLAGLFAALYGFRLGLNTQAMALLLDQPTWLPYIRSALEYLVPIPAAFLFERFFGARWRLLSRLICWTFVAVAVLAIGYETAARAPYAGMPVINAIVLAFMLVYVINVLTPAPDQTADWRAIRVGAATFGAFALNEHLRLVNDPFGISREPTGMVIFIGILVMVLMRQALRTRVRLASVDGELATARRIQLSTIPQAAPAIEGIEVSTLYLPASEVAGDFYDFIAVDPRRFGVLIADVSGHGVPAALVASMLKIALATQSALASSPARLLAELNALFTGRLERQFITAAYVFIDSAAGSIRIASAGHPPPLLLRAAGGCEELLANGVVLGRFRSARYEEVEAAFGAGDTLVLYTDGITEAQRADGEMFGEERLRETLGRAAATEGVAAALRSWTANRQEDDITLLVVRHH